MTADVGIVVLEDEEGETPVCSFAWRWALRAWKDAAGMAMRFSFKDCL